MCATVFSRLRHEEDGVLSFEWTLLVVLLVFGIVTGVSAARDVIIDELGDYAQAILAIDQTYSFAGIPGVIDASSYTDTQVVVSECDRNGPAGNNGQDDGFE